MQQTMSRPQPNIPPNNQNSGPARTQSLIITAITLFALSGLIIGFAAGAITRPRQAAQPTTVAKSNQSTVQQAQPTAEATKVTPQKLGCPVIDQGDGEGVADGSSTHTFRAHVIDASAGTSGSNCFNGKPIQAAGITCKLWLTKSTDDAVKGAEAVWTDVNAVKQPIKGEVEGGLIFSGAQQTQMSNNQGQATWKFSVSPDVKHGDYFVVVMTDWDGKYYNLSWWKFTVKKAS